MSLTALVDRSWDLLIIGGGIHGAFAAWDATRRGLRVALVDRGDFGGAASANSLRILHGGFRYLQSLSLARVRESSAERERIARLAPHLVTTLPCVVPTGFRLSRSRPVLKGALVLHDLLTRRTTGPRGGRDAPAAGRLVSAAEYRRLASPLAVPRARGGALWHDARLESPDRLLIAVVRAAQGEGAVVANYVEALRLVRRANDVAGAVVRDESGQEAEVSARLVLIAANAGAPGLAPAREGSRGGGARQTLPGFARACNVVVDRAPPSVAVAIPGRGRSRSLFAVPWRGRTVIGTTQHSETPGDAPPVTASHVATDAVHEVITSVNEVIPDASLTPDDVRLVQTGLLPGTAERLIDTPIVIDHATRDGTAGVVTLIGVKWTTARRTAERAVDLCLRRLGRTPAGAGFANGALPGCAYASSTSLMAESGGGAVDAEVVQRLKVLYGSEYREMLRLVEACPPLGARLGDSLTIGAQIVYGIRHEMAQHLDDLVLRRTELGSAGHPGAAALRAAAAVAASELGWTDATASDEIARVVACYPAGR